MNPITKDLENLKEFFGVALDDISIFGSFTQEVENPSDIDVLLMVKKGHEEKATQFLASSKLSLPILDINVHSYKKREKSKTTFGYHFFIKSN